MRKDLLAAALCLSASFSVLADYTYDDSSQKPEQGAVISDVDAKKYVENLPELDKKEQADLVKQQQKIIDDFKRNPNAAIANSNLPPEQKEAFLKSLKQAEATTNVPSCGALLCLSGQMSGGDLAECQQPIDAYFAIKKYRKKNKFDPAGTAKARKKYIDKCDAPNAAKDKQMVNSTYGTLFGRP